MRSAFLHTALCALPALLATCLAAANGSALPAPLRIPPSQYWEGIDGSWNTFPLRIGTPEQYTRGFISTASQQTWAVYERACLVNQTDPKNPEQLVQKLDGSCFDSRGRTFNYSTSTSWDNIGFYQLWLEKNIKRVGNGKYGYEKVGLGYTAPEGPTLDNTTVGVLVTDNFWLGHFGINPKSTNFTAFTDPSPSYMSQLFQKKQIPSVSWGYTAGAQYRNDITLASLTLGGYDASRLIPNDLTFGFAPDNERDIVVGVVDIRADSNSKHGISLVDEKKPFTMYIDSTVAELFLPIDVCEAFEKAFGLTYDNDTQLYLVDELLHTTLLEDNPTITFTFGQKYATNATIDIPLPYAALDHWAKPPYSKLRNATRYFPIRRSEKEDQYILGRTFLQEAYLTVDWERQNFSVSQVNWTKPNREQIVSIISPVYTGESQRNESDEFGPSLRKGPIAAIAVSATLCVVMASITLWWFRRRRSKQRQEASKSAYMAQVEVTAKGPEPEKGEDPPTSPISEEGGSNVFPKAELPAEFYGDVKDGDLFAMPSPAVEVGNTERQIFEMPGDMPMRQEAGGRQLSEKESMMVRERIYNGVDPSSPLPKSPSYEAPRRPAPINASEVTLVGKRMPNVSPITPRTPRDGASLEASDTFFQVSTRSTQEDTVLSPISPMEDNSRRRFSYET